MFRSISPVGRGAQEGSPTPSARAPPRQGLLQHGGQTRASGRASVEGGGVAGAAETPVQNSSAVAFANAPGRHGSGGVAYLGAYHTTGKSLQRQLATLSAAPSRSRQHSVPVLDRRPARSGTLGAEGGGGDRSSGEPQVAVNAKLVAAVAASTYSQYGSYVLGERVRKLAAVKKGGRDDPVLDAEKENVRVPAPARGVQQLRGRDDLLIRQLGLSQETLDLVLPARPRVNR